MKKQSVQALYEKIETQRKEILFQYDQLKPEQRQFKPGPDKWNLLQVLRHLTVAEKQSLLYIQRKLNNQGDVAESGLGTAFRSLVLKLALWVPIKYKAPKIADVSEDYPNFEAMRNEWESIRADIQSIIEKHDEQTLSKNLYRHPIAGKMNFKQALVFFESHISHHQKQIERIMKHPAFPH